MKALAIFILTAAVLYTLGEGSNDELARQQRLYCAMVAEGTWPDYQSTYEANCK